MSKFYESLWFFKFLSGVFGLAFWGIIIGCCINGNWWPLLACVVLIILMAINKTVKDWIHAEEISRWMQ